MNNLNNLRPEKIYDFFRQISEIPRGSGNTDEIAQFCLDFAKDRNLKAVKDCGGNVIIYANGTKGYESCEPVIIQGHMDMVCEKIPECDKDMSKEGITLCTDGEYLWAEGTTLGGDDGIAMAYIFALLDSDDIPHPPIEAVITRDEETGMFGAAEFDAGLVKGKKMLNIDSEEEGILTVSCAGGISAHCDIPFKASLHKMNFAFEISVSNLIGGHSGVDINKGRANAFKVIAELLSRLYKTTPFCIADINGGGKMNVIPQFASVTIGTDSDCADIIQNVVSDFSADFAEKFSAAEPNAEFTVKPAALAEEYYDPEKLIQFLIDAPNGVQSMSESMPDMVQTSLNIGVLSLNGGTLSVDFLIRSNSMQEKQKVMKAVTGFAAEYNGTIEFSADYPAWEYRKNSPLRDIMISVFRDLYGREPQISAIHAGLECGIFSEKIKDADIVSFGPDIENIHTPTERMSIASVERTWEYIKEILKNCK